MKLSSLVAPLAVFLCASTLLVNRLSFASDPLTSALAGKQASSPIGSPTCTDLTKVKGPVIVFGFEGKFPYSVEIDSKGEISAKGIRDLEELPPAPFSFGFERDTISPSTVRALIQLANANSFWKLPNVIGQDANPDTAATFIAVNLSCASHRVVIQDKTKMDTNVQRFAEMYTLLTDLVYEEPFRYKPLQ